ncbi:NUDIX domain-containing protein [Glycomyces sp. NPDC047369]
MQERLDPRPGNTADVVILTIREERFEVLLIRRGNPPFKGMLAIPGGYLEDGENLEATAERELKEETALEGMTPHLELVGVYSDPGRDPRGVVISAAYVAMIPDPPKAEAGGDAASTQWCTVERALAEPLAFDHSEILSDALAKASDLLETTTAATAFCKEQFTISELRRVYEIVWGVKLDPGNFHRKVTRIEGFIEPTGERTIRDGGRPAALFRTGPAKRIYLPRPENDE